jgi:hypothetical protein
MSQVVHQELMYSDSVHSSRDLIDRLLPCEFGLINVA